MNGFRKWEIQKITKHIGLVLTSVHAQPCFRLRPPEVSLFACLPSDFSSLTLWLSPRLQSKERTWVLLLSPSWPTAQIKPFLEPLVRWAKNLPDLVTQGETKNQVQSRGSPGIQPQAVYICTGKEYQWNWETAEGNSPTEYQYLCPSQGSQTSHRLS